MCILACMDVCSSCDYSVLQRLDWLTQQVRVKEQIVWIQVLINLTDRQPDLIYMMT